MSRFLLLIALSLFLSGCIPEKVPSASIEGPVVFGSAIPSGFTIADGSRPLTFPQDFGAHEDFSTEWWYYTGNLQTAEGRHFGFELTIFRVGLFPPGTELPSDSKWYGRSLYFAHFAVSDTASDKFYAFERYSRPGPGLAGSQADPFQAWLEDWKISEQAPGVYQLHAEQDGVALDLTLVDEMGVVLHGQNGFSRKGRDSANASYYFSQPRLRTEGTVQVDGARYPLSGLAWMDQDFSSGSLDEDQVGWDWFSLQFEDGSALMIFQLREGEGKISEYSSGTFVGAEGVTRPLNISNYQVTVLDTWRSPHTGGEYPSAWEIHLNRPDCLLQARPWMADQELHFPAVTYWEGAVHFEGTCDGKQVQGNGYIELTGYAGNLPLR